ncbi:MAG: hypothetical protein MPJ50_12290 [Pirellulales bacterium]|nr:hypothetical protein [Pirellulales bacterium]
MCRIAVPNWVLRRLLQTRLVPISEVRYQNRSLKIAFTSHFHQTIAVRPMLTLFTCPKPFEGHIGLIQRNALLSWQRLRPVCEVILVGKEPGLAEFATEHKFTHVSDIERNEYGTPLISSIFAQAESAARFDLLAYVNADIILFDDFLAALRKLSMPRFLAVGRRLDIRIDEPLDFEDEGWPAKLIASAESAGRMNIPWAMDYFAYTRGAWAEIPPFAIGRFGFDNWLVYGAKQHDTPIVDLTDAVTVIHQNHDYARTPGFEVTNRNSPEILRNLQLCGAGEDYGVRDADWRLIVNDVAKSPAGVDLAQALQLEPNKARYLASCKRMLRKMLGKSQPWRKAA